MLRTILTRLVIAGLTLAVDADLGTASAQNLTETFELVPSDTPFGARFGSSVAMSGRIGIIGAPNDQVNGWPVGSAYLFDVATGQEIAKLLPSDGAPHDKFGWSVAISGDLAVVGAPFDQDNGPSSGSIYLFDLDTGAQLAKLVPNDGNEGHRFGYSVAIQGGTIFSGAIYALGPAHNAGSVYLFDAVTHQEIGRLQASDSAPGYQFGSSIDVSGDVAIVGAPNYDSARGCAYIFDVSDPANPQELNKITATDSSPLDYFGADVAINDEIAAVGAPNADVGSLRDIGSAYLFDVNTGVQLSRITPPWTLTNAFATSVSISGENIVIGDPGTNLDFQSSGIAYVFHADTGTLIAMLQSAHNNEGSPDMEGFDVSMQGNSILVGAPWHSHDGNNGSGVSHLFHLEPGNPFCFGETWLLLCPCDNFSGFNRGCSNSTGVGAALDAGGSTSVVHDNLALHSSDLPAGTGLYVQANNYILGFFGYGSPFGDGLRCVGGGLIRLEVQHSSGGTSQTTISIVTRGKVSAGDTKRYQYYYRDANGSPCGTGFNLTNGYQLTWTP